LPVYCGTAIANMGGFMSKDNGPTSTLVGVVFVILWHESKNPRTGREF
jgi:hypothetical protein